MYIEHFGLREAPFALTPDTEYYFGTDSHRQALNVLLVALESGEGFIKIAGEVGTGKTLLCRKLLTSLPERMVSAYLPNPLLSPLELHKALAEELGLEVAQGATLHELRGRLQQTLIDLAAAGNRVIVCVDEAQAMPDASLEALRLLSNLETEKRKLLQIVLFAQPELDERLRQPGLRQLRQRLVHSFKLVPLCREGVANYIGHRLLVAGFQGGGLFRRRTIDLIFQASGGVPRLVNILSHKALLVAYGQGARMIDRQHVLAAIRDTEDAALRYKPLVPFLYGGVGMVLALEIWLLVYLLRGGTL